MWSMVAISGWLASGIRKCLWWCHYIDAVRIRLVKKTFHHFGSNTKMKNERYIALTGEVRKMPKALIFHLKKHK